MKKLVIFNVFYFCLLNLVTGGIVGQIRYKSKIYYVDVIISGNAAKVWARTNKNMCSTTDFVLTNLSVSKETLNDAKKKVCRVKKTYDNGKTIAGCAATVGTGICAIVTGATEGSTAILCYSVWDYTVDKGFADCVSGIKDKIADFLGASREWAVYRTAVNVDAGKWKNAISSSIDAMCADEK